MSEIVVGSVLLALIAGAWWLGRRQGRADEHEQSRRAAERIRLEADELHARLDDVGRAALLERLRELDRGRRDSG